MGTIMSRIRQTLQENIDEKTQKNSKRFFKEEVKCYYVLKNKKKMPRTALRYAIEKMPEGMRKEGMQK